MALVLVRICEQEEEEEEEEEELLFSFVLILREMRMWSLDFSIYRAKMRTMKDLHTI